jgi:predicted nicotinamide N-methyase
MIEYLREYEFEDSLSIPPVKVCQCPESQYGLGSTVWDAALVLCAFFESRTGRDCLRNRKCIELGSGTGIVSIAASMLGPSEVIATDVDACIPFIRQNIGMNFGAKCKAEPLDWTKHEEFTNQFSEYFDWVICADCVYEPTTVESLIATVTALNPRKGIIVCNERRDMPGNSKAEKDFITAMFREGYTGKAVSREIIKPEWRCDDIDIVIFEKNILEERKGA